MEEDTEREVFHPAGTEEHLTQEEIDRRERTGEKQSGGDVVRPTVTCEGRCSYREMH